VQKIIIIISLSCIGTTLPALCQQAYYSYAAPHLFSANAGGRFTNALNAGFNPSLLPYIKNVQAATYAEKKYATDLNILLLTICAPVHNNSISLIFQRFGNTSFNENTFGLSYGKNIGRINVGLAFQHLRVRIPDAEMVSLIKAGIASSMKVGENVFVSCRISNPNLFAKTGSAKLRAASSFSLSFGFEATAEVYTAIESLKEEGRPLSLIFSLNYRLAEKFTCTLNWSTYTNQPFVAISWQQKLIAVEAGCSYHATLGASPAISLLFKKPEEK
jgi:hypothetical protein